VERTVRWLGGSVSQPGGMRYAAFVFWDP
jgi:hypothetical protein